jgi:hypothetical protein
MRLTVAVAMEVLLGSVAECSCCCCSEIVSGLRRLLKPSCEVVDDM